MSTQHPDNVRQPFFAGDVELQGEDEIQEAYYAFSHLGCDEQMWDCEGKEVDSFVVKKLLTRYEPFFREKRLGDDIRLTLRVPNPLVERAEAKVLLETLESIPRSYDVAEIFYGDDLPPIFEVILPMTTSAQSIDRVYKYYRDFVAGKQDQCFEDDIRISEWIGQFKPGRVNVIPLFEDMENLLNAHRMTREYLRDKDVGYQRVFLARSDPAMNYGLVSAVLLNKIALQRLEGLEDDIGVDIYPIVGVGSAPFRGNLRPDTVERTTGEYPNAHTFTIQSAFKYDNPPDEVRRALQWMRRRDPRPAQVVDEGRALDIIQRYSREYQRQVMELAPIINKIAGLVPARRKRKLHTGLFGYSRDVEGISLPRAIKFTAALYSIGLPPELLGLNALQDTDWAFIRENYENYENDLRDALQYYNPDNGFTPPGLRETLGNVALDFEVDLEHRDITRGIEERLRANNLADLGECIVRAANLRRFLG